MACAFNTCSPKKREKKRVDHTEINFVMCDPFKQYKVATDEKTRKTRVHIVKVWEAPSYSSVYIPTDPHDRKNLLRHSCVVNMNAGPKKFQILST